MLLQGVGKSLLTKPYFYPSKGKACFEKSSGNGVGVRWVSEPLGISHSDLFQEKAMDMTLFLIQCRCLLVIVEDLLVGI